jgi:hypothetical protein
MICRMGRRSVVTLRLRDLPRPNVRAQGLQPASEPMPSAEAGGRQDSGTRAIAQITTITLEKTEDGVQLRLQTADGTPLQGTSASSGNGVTVTFAQAQLQQAFRQEAPIPGIRAIVATNTTPDSVTVTITSSDDQAPDVELTQAGADTILGILAGEEEVIVTAQKRQERAQDVPIALSVFDAKAVEDQQIGNIADLAARPPKFNGF